MNQLTDAMSDIFEIIQTLAYIIEYLIKFVNKVVGLYATKYKLFLRRNHNCQTLQLSFKFVDENSIGARLV